MAGLRNSRHVIDWAGMRIVIVGAGYLGSQVATELEDAGHDVVRVTRSGGDGALACDVSDSRQVARLPEADAVVHCAASGRGGVDAYRAVYYDGCRFLADRYGGKPLLFTSSTSVYAQTDGSVVDEKSLAEPVRETGRILREAEEMILAAAGGVARLAGIYGPGRSVILRKFLEGSAVIEEDGRRILNQIHRDDAATAVVRLIGERGIHCVSDSRPLTQLECYQALSAHFGKPLPPSGPRDLNRKRGWTHKRVSNAKIRSLGWEPEYPCFLDAVACGLKVDVDG